MSGVNKIISLGRSGAVTAARAQISRTLPGATEIVKEVTATETVTTKPKQEICWMRNPNTGCWAPEDSFDVLDIAELRDQVLSNTHTTKHLAHA